MMARKLTYCREAVALAALDVMDAEGSGAVTARRVAKALGSSTAPVYSNFDSMEDLLEVVYGLIVELILDYCRRPWTQDPFLSMGLGFVHFVCDHPQLFRALYLEPPGTRYDENEVMTELIGDLKRHPFLGDLPQDHMDELLFQASIYTLGIATAVVTERWQDPNLLSVESWLRSIGGLLARAALRSAGLPIPAEAEESLGKFVVPWRHPHCPARNDQHKDAHHE